MTSNFRNSTKNRVTGEEEGPSAGSQGFGAIPTTDPAAALQFCRNLARALAMGSYHFASGQLEPRSPDRVEGTLRSDSTQPDLSVVVPLYNEEENVAGLHARLTPVLKNTNMDCEIIFVDDGSRDKTWELLARLVAEDSHVTAIQLARNFGHQVAISAGLNHTQGKAVVVMDGDLQDPPEVLPHFIAKWREGYDVVYAVRERRKEGWLKRSSYAIFYRLLQKVATIEIPLDSGDFCIMDRRVVNILVSMPERNRFVRGIRSWVGLNQIGLPIERDSRYAGASKYTLGRLIYLALDGLISFSYVPLRVITMLGFSVSVLSLFLALFYAIKKLTTGLNPPGFATLTVAVFFLAGIQLVTIGVIGEYIGRIFDEVKQRPLYVVRQIIASKD